MFDEIDTNDNGLVDTGELAIYLKSTTSQDETKDFSIIAADYVSGADEDNDGFLDPNGTNLPFPLGGGGGGGGGQVLNQYLCIGVPV